MSGKIRCVLSLSLMDLSSNAFDCTRLSEGNPTVALSDAAKKPKSTHVESIDLSLRMLSKTLLTCKCACTRTEI